MAALLVSPSAACSRPMRLLKAPVSGYVFETVQKFSACHLLLAAAKKREDTASVPAIETILAEEREMHRLIDLARFANDGNSSAAFSMHQVPKRKINHRRVYVSTRQTAAIHGSRC